MTSPAQPVFLQSHVNLDSQRTALSRERPALALLCHCTGTILKDPVVGSDGYAYERSAIERECGDVKLYPNRAIKSFLQIYQERQPTIRTNSTTSSTRATTNKSLREAFRTNQLLSREFFTRKKISRRPAESFFCPITMQQLVRPVIDPAGHSYYHNVIVAWIRRHHSSPVTRQALDEKDLGENLALAQLMEVASEEEEEELAGNATSVCQWRENRKRKGDISESHDAPETLEEWERRSQRQQRNEMTWEILLAMTASLS